MLSCVGTLMARQAFVPASRYSGVQVATALGTKCFAAHSNGDAVSLIHFRHSNTPHPFKVKPHDNKNEKFDFNGRLQNHVWSEAEVQERLENLWQHRPATISDMFVHKMMWSLYKSFNFVTGFKPQHTPVKAVEWRLIVLESFAGVPGFVAAMFRHFRSLRQLQRDHGWIHTLLEEAENERMHLIVCMSVFKANLMTRFMVIAAQLFMTPWLAAAYLVHPKAVHRFVGYLEETACLTYANIIDQVQTPGTPLHEAWADMDAPEVAKVYWKLDPGAKWIDVLKCMFADECNHRDVNHTFAVMKSDDPNPFVKKLAEDAALAWRLDNAGMKTDVGCRKTLSTLPGHAQQRA